MVASSAAEKPRENAGMSPGKRSNTASSIAMYGAMPAQRSRSCWPERTTAREFAGLPAVSICAGAQGTARRCPEGAPRASAGPTVMTTVSACKLLQSTVRQVGWGGARERHPGRRPRCRGRRRGRRPPAAAPAPPPACPPRWGRPPASAAACPGGTSAATPSPRITHRLHSRWGLNSTLNLHKAAGCYAESVVLRWLNFVTVEKFGSRRLRSRNYSHKSQRTHISPSNTRAAASGVRGSASAGLCPCVQGEG